MSLIDIAIPALFGLLLIAWPRFVFLGSKATPDAKKIRYRIDRRWALLLAEQGRWAEARPHLWRWYKHKPDSTRALRFLNRSLFARKKRASA